MLTSAKPLEFECRRGIDALSNRTGGWVTGHFMPDGVAKTTDVEIKPWLYEKQPDYPPKRWDGHEFIIVYGGTLVIELCEHGSSIKLQGETWDYVILPPGVIKKVIVPEGRTFGLSVRWPSLAGNNKVLK